MDMTGKKFGGRFVIESEIGEGGMAKVYRAKDEHLGGTVALKLIKSQIADSAFIERFKEEAKTLKKVKHPNIVQVYDHGEDNGINWIAMDLIEGKTLEDILAEKKTLPWNKVLDIGKNVTDALNYAHEMGIIHRDLKPGNIMIDKFDRAILTDFGIAKDTAATRKTLTGELIGSPSYMSPEQANEKDVDARSDIWSFGVICYEALTGKRPFDKEGHYVKTLTSIIKDEPDMPRKFNKKIPKKVQNIIMKALEKNADERYQNALQLKQDFDNYLDGNRLIAGGTLKKQIKKLIRDHPYITAGALALVMAASGIGIYSHIRQETLSSLQNKIQKTEVTDEMFKPNKDGTENEKLSRLKNLYDSLETKIFTERVMPMIEKGTVKEGEYPMITNEKGEWIKGRGEGGDEGFWPSILWLGYNHFTEKANDNELSKGKREKFAQTAEKFKKWAVNWTLPLEYRKTENTQTNIADIFWPFVQAYEATGDRKFRDAALTAAETVCKRFKEKAKFLQDAGNINEKTINKSTSSWSLPHLNLLWWAYDQTGDKKFYDIALQHAETMSKVFIKEDGSVYNRAGFDLEKGIPTARYDFRTNRKFKADFAAAQTFYGLNKAYQITGKKEFLENANKVFKYYKNMMVNQKELNSMPHSIAGMALSEHNPMKNTELMDLLKKLTSKEYFSGKIIINHCRDPPVLEDGSYICADYWFLNAIDNLSKERFPARIFNAFKGTPKIDGNLDDLVWKETIPQTMLLQEKTGVLSEHPTLSWISYDDKNLYFAFKCSNPLASKTKERDGQMWKWTYKGEDWENDAIEIAIDDKKDNNPYYNFIVNSINMQYDAIARNKDWNAEWQSKTKIHPDYWTAEIAIPLKEIGDSKEFDINIIRQRYPEKITWNYTPKTIPKNVLNAQEIPDYRFGKLKLK